MASQAEPVVGEGFWYSSPDPAAETAGCERARRCCMDQAGGIEGVADVGGLPVH